MDYRALLVHIEPDSTSSDARLHLAASLAKRFSATLIGCSAAAIHPVPVGDPYSGAFIDGRLIEAEQEQIEASLEKAKDAFSREPACQDLLTEWRSGVAMPADFIAQEARAADLIVIGRDLERIRLGAYRSADPGDVLMRAGRPLLVVPPGLSDVEAKRVVVGWKDARESRRAVWDALPLLKRAEAVHVVGVVEKDGPGLDSTRLADVVAFLSRHDVNARADVRGLREASVTDELILAAETEGADLIVVGGYGHARVREWVFGGITRYLLHRSPKCCLLSH